MPPFLLTVADFSLIPAAIALPSLFHTRVGSILICVHTLRARCESAALPGSAKAPSTAHQLQRTSTDVTAGWLPADRRT